VQITYTARRSLTATHIAGNDYVISIDTTALIASTRVEKVSQRAIGGATETLYSRTDREWSITFVPLRGAQLAQLIEFLDSTERGETFRMMLPGDASPGTICIRTDDGYTLSEYMPLGDAAALDWYQTSCSVREV
jgi:hypothetical protein